MIIYRKKQEELNMRYEIIMPHLSGIHSAGKTYFACRTDEMKNPHKAEAVGNAGDREEADSLVQRMRPANLRMVKMMPTSI